MNSPENSEPPKDMVFRPVDIPVKEMDYLRKYLTGDEQNHSMDGYIFEKSVKFMYDLLRCDEEDWKLTCSKMKFEEGKVSFHEGYAPNQMILPLGPLILDGMRLFPEDLEKKAKL